MSLGPVIEENIFLSFFPGFYDPQILPKQSFFYNDSRVWIPV